MAWQKDTQASQTGSVRVGTTAHWKIIKQTIKDGRRPPPNDLWQLIMYEKEPQSSQKCLARKLHNSRNQKRHDVGDCRVGGS